MINARLGESPKRCGPKPPNPGRPFGKSLRRLHGGVSSIRKRERNADKEGSHHLKWKSERIENSSFYARQRLYKASEKRLKEGVVPGSNDHCPLPAQINYKPTLGRGKEVPGKKKRKKYRWFGERDALYINIVVWNPHYPLTAAIGPQGGPITKKRRSAVWVVNHYGIVVTCHCILQGGKCIFLHLLSSKGK